MFSSDLDEEYAIQSVQLSWDYMRLLIASSSIQTVNLQYEVDETGIYYIVISSSVRFSPST